MPTSHHVGSLPSQQRDGRSLYVVIDMKLTMLARHGQEIYISIAMNNVIAPPKPRGRPREFDRDEVLESAMRLFWTRGYEATSISDLTKAMHITPPALYSAFGDKKGLFLEAVRRYEQGAGCFAQKALTEEPTAELAIRRLLLDAVKSFTDPKNPKGCLIVLGATNCTIESTDVFKALAERRRTAENVVRARIAAGQKAGELSDNADVDALTGMVTATLYGLAIKARDGVPRARLRTIIEQLMMMWPRREADDAEAARRMRVSSRARKPSSARSG
jgi:AcrR family transcriptional regulator